MIATLSNFDRKQALGLLARTAIAFDDEGNPAAAYRLPNELDLRRRILAEVRQAVGVRSDDQSEDATQKVEDALDRALDELSEPSDPTIVLQSLSDKGKLPSDLYGIDIVPNVADVYGKKWFPERKLIHATIKSPDQEQHFEPHPGNDVRLLSLFSKRFPSQFPLRSFVMLVVGQRTGLTLNVTQAWRIYPDAVDLSGAPDLLDVLRRFAGVFGTDFTIDGVQGKFQLELDGPNLNRRERAVVVLPVWATDGKGRKVEKPVNVLISMFNTHSKEGVVTSALTTVINLDRYRAMLSQHGW